jgi:hypothetical protein
MSTFNADVIAATALAQETFENTQSIIDGMADGERIQIKDLVSAVAKKMVLPIKEVVEFVSWFAHHIDSAYVTRGKNGGLIKGARIVKPVKVSKKQKKVIAEAAKLFDNIQTGTLPDDTIVSVTGSIS